MASFTRFDMAVNDLKMLNGFLVQGMDVIRSAAADACDGYEGDAVEKNVDRLKQDMKSLVVQESDTANFVRATEALKTKLRQMPVVRLENLRQKLKTEHEAVKAIPANPPESHASFKDLLKIVASVEGGCSVGEGEDSMIVTEDLESGQYKDPITQKDIEVPVRNIRCNHTYDKNSITYYIKNTRYPKCPYLGCSNKRLLRLEDLVVNHFVARILKQRLADKN